MIPVMGILHVHVAYRPFRIGWCVRHGHFEDFEQALRLSHTLWGGRNNPVIVIDDPLAAGLVNAFRLDTLYPISADDLVQAFVGRFPHLRWPGIGSGLFEGGFTSFQDISRPLQRYCEKMKPGPNTCKLYTWDQADPLALVLLSSLGGYPCQAAVGTDYGSLFRTYIGEFPVVIKPNSPFPPFATQGVTPSLISSYDLVPEHPPGSPPGFYVGDAADFSDLVNFWNLRAAGVGLVFYDHVHAERLSKFVETYPQIMEWAQKAERGLVAFAVIARPGFDAPQAIQLGKDVEKYNYVATTEFMLGLASRAPLMYFQRSESSLASVDEQRPRSLVSIQLPENPLRDDRFSNLRKVIVSVYPGAGTSENFETTLWTPFIPELNDYYREALSFAPQLEQVRSERAGVGIIASPTTEAIVVRELPKTELIAKIFGHVGLKAEPSQAGRVAGRLVTQMGGLSGCRVFKIAGVRALINKYDPLQSFTRDEAVQVIGQTDAVKGKDKFRSYEELNVVPGQDGKLKPDRVFDYLLEKRVFRAGLSLRCLNCDLEFWKPLGELQTDVPCEYCGMQFNITPQLRNRGGWAFRRSGLFGRQGHQEGSIPVALTLQQIDAHNGMRRSLLLPAMNVVSGCPSARPCETDLVILMQGKSGKLEIGVGECKENGEITNQDASNMAEIAAAFPSDRFESFVIFSKTGTFSAEEISRCRSCCTRGKSRVILLDGRDLEPEFAYIRDGPRSNIPTEGASLVDFAFETEIEYFKD
jgi:hypothetical protein